MSSPITAEVCKPLQKLTSVKTDWAWNGMYQELYDKAMKLIKQDVCKKFYDTSKALYLETDTYGISLGVGLLHLRDGMNCGLNKILNNTALCLIAFVNKSLSSTQWYSNIE